MSQQAIFFDRDGVINRPIVRDGRPFPPDQLNDFEWMDGVRETLREFRMRGFVLLVFTNQPDVARGTTTRACVEAFHRRILAELPVERVYCCFHDDSDGCTCRKPKPGMLLSGRDDYDIDLGRSWVVGDRWRDIEAGRTAGCKTVLVRHGYLEKTARADYEVVTIPELLNVIGATEKS